MKKCTLILIILCMFPLFASAEHTFKYRQVEDGIVLTDCVVDQTIEVFEVPEYIDGYPVVGIDEHALGLRYEVSEGLTKAKHMILPRTIRSIAEYGIIEYWGSIEVDPENEYHHVNDGFLIENATGKAIYHGPSNGMYFDTLVVPAEARILGNAVFPAGGNFRTIALPDGLTRIGSAVFSENPSLEEILLPDSIQVIDSYAFHECTYLENVVFSSGLISIGVDAFAHCESLTHINLPENLMIIDSGAFSVGTVEEIETELTLPNGLRHIGENAFRGRKIKTVETPKSVEYVGDGAFSLNPDATVYYYANTKNIENAVESTATLILIE